MIENEKNMEGFEDEIKEEVKKTDSKDEFYLNEDIYV